MENGGHMENGVCPRYGYFLELRNEYLWLTFYFALC